MNKIPVTRQGYEKMNEELAHLKTTERPNIIQAIATAREHGDLSENAEYSAAREKQSFIEGRILELEHKISRAEIINPSEVVSNIIQFGATVTLEDDSESHVTYQIVGEVEADVENGKININSPLAKAMLGKKQGDFFTLSTISGHHEYEIITIQYK